MKDILFVAHRLPYPPDRGDRIRSWHMLRALAKMAPVHVIAPVDREADRRHVAKLETVAASVTTAVRGSRAAAVARALRSGLPASVELFSVPALHAAVRARLGSGTIGTTVAFSGQMAHYVPRDADVRFVMDFVDMDSAKFAAQADQRRGMAGLALRQEAKRLLAFEISAARRADVATFVSMAEAALFTAATGLGATVLENGVDTAYFSPEAVTPAVTAHPLIVFTGQMDYAPNRDAVAAFSREVMPRLPGATFAIVGRAPTADVKALASDRVVVTGEVSDIRPWLSAADVVVAPLRVARGVQNKILEAMAMARPVVASRVAAEGIDARDGVEIIVADTPEAQADAIARLIADPHGADRLGQAARARVLARYSWDATLAPLSGLVG